MYPSPSGLTSSGSCVTLAFARADFVRGLVLLNMRRRHYRQETLARDKHPNGVKEAQLASRPRAFGMLSRCSRKGEHDDVARMTVSASPQ
jgi:hypothetical protein